jgi:MFS family permease
LALSHLVLISTVIMIMAMLAPGFASRVLGREPEDAVFVFAPAGLGMLLATTLVGRFGYRMRKEWLSNAGLLLMGLGFAGLGLITQGYRILPEPLLQLYPQAALSLTTSVMGISFVLGLTMSGVSILGQTILQEASTPDVRGRVFALQFMLSNLVGIPPMLTTGGLADWVGIPQVMLVVGVAVLAASAISTYYSMSPARRLSLQLSLRRAALAVRHPRAWYARQEWLASFRHLLGRGLRGCRQAWHAIRDSILRAAARLRPGHRSAAARTSGANPPPDHKSASHAEEPAGSIPEQHPED